MKLYGNTLRDARDRKGKTLKEMAVDLEMSIATLSKAENGEDITIPTGRRICEYLGVELARAVVPRSQEGNGDAA